MDINTLTPKQRAFTLVAQLELISHAPAANWGGTGRSSEHPGGKRPPGGASAQDDRHPEFAQKSYLYFKRRLRRCHTEGGFLAIAADAQKALDAWKRTPPPGKDTPSWRELIARDTRGAVAIAEEYGISRQTVWNIKCAYRDKAA